MQRREFITLMGVAAVTQGMLPQLACAQASTKRPLLAVLAGVTRREFPVSFMEGVAIDPIPALARPRLLELHLHNCEAFVRKRRACRIPKGSSRRASLRYVVRSSCCSAGPSPRRMSEPPFAPSGRVVPRPA
jgi:hypothetical protein